TNLIASGLDSEDPTIQIIQLMSAIEALVEQKTFVQGITDQVCERAALLLGKDSTSRRKIFDRLTTLYGKRSSLSHGDTAVITP
ncbi:HEPN domain-containing protein, partial [Lactobacillus helveticus]|uniref:HEPN domain-containing protein n=1 Tax=Lactobacillus helveticus TaxID=1587 RepID=UPI001561F5E9